MSAGQALENQLDAAESAPPPTALHTIVLWDWPLRLFHWTLVALVSAAVVTGKIGGDWMVWHGRAGVGIAGLIAFRLVWGLVGSTHARFASFIPLPSDIVRYLKGIWFGVGHNPIGALSVLALLTILSFQAATGLVSNDDISFTGPWADAIDESLSLQLTNWHHKVADGLLVLIGLHVVAIFAYRILKKIDLVKPMVTGRKAVPRHIAKPQPFKVAGLVVALSLAALTVWLANAPAAIRTLSSPPTQTQAADTPQQPASATHQQAAPAW